MATQLVRDVMTEPVVAARPDTGYKEIVEVIARFGVSALPVIDDDCHVLGVVSEADLLHKVEFTGEDMHARLFERRRRSARKKAAGDTAGELMTSPPITVGPEAPAKVAARLMDSAQVKRLPVVDAEGRLLGIVARRDLLRVYVRSDATIQHDVVNQVLRRTLLLAPSEIDVSVTDGIVTLRGTTDRRSTAQIAVRLTHTVDGVVDVTDELTSEYDDTADIRRGYVIPRESDVYSPGNRPAT
jgi:CBS domain-containing protein